jgi:hypothetical protein
LRSVRKEVAVTCLGIDNGFLPLGGILRPPSWLIHSGRLVQYSWCIFSSSLKAPPLTRICKLSQACPTDRPFSYDYCNTKVSWPTASFWIEIYFEKWAIFLLLSFIKKSKWSQRNSYLWLLSLELTSLRNNHSKG